MSSKGKTMYLKSFFVVKMFISTKKDFQAEFSELAIFLFAKLEFISVIPVA